LERPADEHRDRKVERSVDYLREHFTEPLSLITVARVAGFAPRYFSYLFKRRMQMTFEHYLGQLRIERAKLLLATHDLNVQQVGRLSGFPERHYFNQAFKRVVRMTPLEYRRAHSSPSRKRRPASGASRA
jgi:AraC-like DNA-binding protein